MHGRSSCHGNSRESFGVSNDLDKSRGNYGFVASSRLKEIDANEI